MSCCAETTHGFATQLLIELVLVTGMVEDDMAVECAEQDSQDNTVERGNSKTDSRKPGSYHTHLAVRKKCAGADSTCIS